MCKIILWGAANGYQIKWGSPKAGPATGILVHVINWGVLAGEGGEGPAGGSFA